MEANQQRGAWVFPAIHTHTPAEMELFRVSNANRLLLNACRAVDADIELTGKVSEESVLMVREAIAKAGV